MVNSPPYNGQCFALTGDLTVEGAVSVTSSFFDGKNVARGWQQKFTGGSGASCGAIGQSRTFTFVHMCDRTTPTPPMNPGSNIAFVDEISGCDYAAFMYSQLGCATRAFSNELSVTLCLVARCLAGSRYPCFIVPPRIAPPTALASTPPAALSRRVSRDGQGRVQQRRRVRV